MVVVGLVLIPTLGAVGALVAYLVSRVAEVQLFVHEARRLPRSVLPRWKVATVLGMVVALSALAAVHYSGGPV